MTRVELEPTAVVAGGDALARDGDGRVVFVTGALPGERVVAELTEERRDYRRAEVVDVLTPSPDRVAPPCANVAAGCGGCGWQHVAVDAQRRLKTEVIADALVRVGKLARDGLPPIAVVPLPATEYRTTVRAAVVDGRAAFHERRGPGTVDAAGCLVAHPLVAEILDHGRFGSAAEVIVRASVASGQRVVLLDGTVRLRDVEVPPDVEVVAARSPALGAVVETVAGRRFRVSIRSFFQAGPAIAAALAETVGGMLAGTVRAGDRVADLYAGVGLFGGTLADAFGVDVTAVERAASSAADARRNLADIGATVISSEVARWRPDAAFSAVVADPARPGLARPGVDAVVRSQAETLVLVSCDAASLGRDVRLLADAGWALRVMTLVDAFPHTPHVEVVSRFAPV